MNSPLPTRIFEVTTPQRLNSLCDGVFSIAMTLLVLELRVPETKGLIDADQFVELLNALAPSISGFLISFFVIGVYWSIHNRISKFVVAVDKVIVRYTFFMLLGISLLPFSTLIQGKFGYLGLATSLYSLNVALCGLSAYRIWSYCSKNPEFISPDTPAEMRAHFKYRLMVAPAVFLLSIPVSFLSPSWARYTWLLCLLGPKLIGCLFTMQKSPFFVGKNR